MPFFQYLAGFDNIFTAFNCMYGLITLDNYPEIMIPALQYSELYLFYFIPFIILVILILIPVPVGVAFEAFRVLKLS
jgi:hypothetical protein